MNPKTKNPILFNNRFVFGGPETGGSPEQREVTAAAPDQYDNGIQKAETVASEPPLSEKTQHTVRTLSQLPIGFQAPKGQRASKLIPADDMTAINETIRKPNQLLRIAPLIESETLSTQNGSILINSVANDSGEYPFSIIESGTTLVSGSINTTYKSVRI